METFFAINRFVHIAAGFIGFFVAPVALATRKGGPAHRRWGKVFFWTMVVAGTTALVGSQHIHSLFLLLTAVFSLYMAGFGYRSLFLKQLAWDARVAAFDWAVAGVGLLVFLGTVGYAFVAGNVPVGVFGGIGAATAIRQLRQRRPLDQKPVVAQPYFGLYGFVHRGCVGIFGHQPALHSVSLQLFVAHRAGCAPHSVVAPSGTQPARYAGTSARFIRLTNAGPS